MLNVPLMPKAGADNSTNKFGEKPQNYIAEYLKSCAEKTKEHEIVLCLGTQACDPDSFVSSIVLGIHENAIPVMNISREVFETKGDLCYICKLFNISPDDLIFLESSQRNTPNSTSENGQLCLHIGKRQIDLSDAQTVSLILVDHHRPKASLSKYPINLIIDHHRIEDTLPKAQRIYIDIDAGSCCTLVSKFIGHSLMGNGNYKNDYYSVAGFKVTVAKLLSTCIFLDTSGLKKVTSHFDRGEFGLLLNIAGIDSTEINQIVEEIEEARQNDEFLDTRSILLKDYKVFEVGRYSYGYSIVRFPLETWADRKAKNTDILPGTLLLNEFELFQQENRLDFFIVNIATLTNRYLVALDCPVIDELSKSHGFSHRSYRGLSYYEIPMGKTRKILAPIISALLSNMA